MAASHPMPSHPAYEALSAPDVPGVGEGQRLGAEPLEAFLARVPRLAIAFSGGTDSAYLLAAALQAGCDARAYLAQTPFQPSFELDDARQVAELLGAPLRIVAVDLLACDDVCANGPERCYLCKRTLFRALAEAAAEEGLGCLVDGTNATDDPARRPGFRALAELGVASPLRRASLTKADVRERSRALGLPTAEKPRFACLAVHVPRGERLTRDSLAEAARRCGVVE